MDELRTKDYELVRTELRHFQRNQLTIIQVIIEALYLKNIFKLQDDLEEEVNYDKLKEKEYQYN